MAINVTSADKGGAELNTDMNVVPLTDVMLVLLIIFLITVPVVLKQVPLTLPNARNIPTQTKPENIVLAVDKDENVYWNNALITSNDSLVDKLKEKAVLVPQPEVHIRGDKDVRFEAIGRIVVDLQRAGIQKVGFLTEPRNE
ncbi:MAG TPA: biopolymer transporter ExbD [Rhizomicrobium sp.]|nr:biopolymer transporter ExbD [Rhizomicrobium sp.]